MSLGFCLQRPVFDVSDRYLDVSAISHGLGAGDEYGNS